MYKILIKYTSKLNKTFWQSYMTKLEDDTIVEFSTDDMDTLKDTLRMLGNKYGFENLRAINDVYYNVNIDVLDDIENIEVVTTEDITNIYKTAFNKIFEQ